MRILGSPASHRPQVTRHRFAPGIVAGAGTSAFAQMHITARAIDQSIRTIPEIQDCHRSA